MNDKVIEELKDDVLWKLSQSYNVARFISFAPNLDARHIRLSMNDDITYNNNDIRVLLTVFLNICPSVNVRTFRPGKPNGNPFYYGITTVDDVVMHLEQSAREGYYCLVNETIDIHDGGVSGVIDGDIVEFSPDDTPRAVEKPGVCALPRSLAEPILMTVYGHNYGMLPIVESTRIEFSIHPNLVGTRLENVIVWEASPTQVTTVAKPISQWPNNFSRHIGDKAFGLLVAHHLGLPVPFGTVVGRRVAPFSFGWHTFSQEYWTRTCPTEQAPGKFTTSKKLLDPYKLMQNEDPTGTAIQSILFQEGVQAMWSGAALQRGEENIIEGIKGEGTDFMLGIKAPEVLPENVTLQVNELLSRAQHALGRPARIEWVYDGSRVWLVQLHCVSLGSLDTDFSFTQEPDSWLEFDPALGVDELEKLLPHLRQDNVGVILTKSVGVTSHIGDLLRKNEIAAKFLRAGQQ